MVEATRASMISEGTRAFKKCSSANITGEMERRIKATLLGWKPGTSPVIVPNSTPSIEKAKSNSNGKNKSIIIYINKTYYFIGNKVDTLVEGRNDGDRKFMTPLRELRYV